MSVEDARKGRAAMKAKAERMAKTGGQPGMTVQHAPEVQASKGRKSHRSTFKTGGKVDGAKGKARADRVQRKADGGEAMDMTKLGFPPGTTPREARRMIAQGAIRDATALTLGPRRLLEAAPAVAGQVVRQGRNALAESEPVVAAPRSRPEPYPAEFTFNEPIPAMPRGAPRSTFDTANRLADEAVRSRPDRSDRQPMATQPPIEMEIRAQRPAPPSPVPVSWSDPTSDRLNAISMGQSRQSTRGAPMADEMPQNAQEQKMAANLIARRAQIERTPTTGGESGDFNSADDLTPYNTGGAKRGGAIKTGKKKR